jgi:Family of unknown function (DUF6256)
MASDLIPQDVVPVGTGYLILMGVLVAGLRLQRRQGGPGAPGGQGGSGARAAQGAPATGPDAGGKTAGRTARRLAPGWPRFLAQMGSTALGGYLVLMTVVIVYYYGVARVAGQFLASAFTGTALLLAISLPAFAAASWLAERRQRRRAGRPEADD